MKQNALTVVTKVRTTHLAELRTLLARIGQEVRQGRGPFSAIPTIHFACWVIIDNDPNYPPRLAFETSYDGDMDQFIRDLAAQAGDVIDSVYSECAGYPAGGTRDLPAFAQYIKDNSAKSLAFYIGCPGQSVASIRNAIAVRSEIESFLDRHPVRGQKPEEVRNTIQHFIKEESKTKPLPSITLDRVRRRSLLYAIVFGLIGLLVSGVPEFLYYLIFENVIRPVWLAGTAFIVAWLIVVRIHERREGSRTSRNAAFINPEIDPRLFGKEDLQTQNHLTTMVEVTPGLFRLLTLRAVLWLISLLGRTVFVNGKLGTIPTIHFARWVFTDDKKRLLFFSNYDGSWANYLGDFADQAWYGLTGVWGNTIAYPTARWLCWGGARDIDWFKVWSRTHNVYEDVWYSAYPNETLVNIVEDLKVRDGLEGNLNEAATEEWLKRL